MGASNPIAMQNLSLALAFAALATVLAAPVNDNQTPPHLSQAWIAQSKGDGLPGQIGKESYLYEDCPHGKTSADCLHAHIFDYGAATCIKYEIDGGFDFAGTGSYYVACDGVDCCKDESTEAKPDPKQWDISPTSWWKSTTTKYLGKHDTTGLNNETVTGADVWSQLTAIPLTKIGVNYTYYITEQGNDTISHRIDFNVPGQTQGSILYGDFQPQHDIAAFRKTFMPPPQCLKNNVLACGKDHAKNVALKYNKHEAIFRGWA